MSQIWVAAVAGGYKPAGTGGPRTATFDLVNGVSVLGGFAGVESLEGQRDPVVNVTILSGDLNSDDDSIGNDENSFHVTKAVGLDASAILDGFVIRAGNADAGDPDRQGAGLYAYQSTATIRNCVFTDNFATLHGGAAYAVQFGGPTFDHCTFSENTTPGDGGGLFLADASVTAIACAFDSNSALSGISSGGAVAGSNGSLNLTSCTFTGNSAGSNGGALSLLNSGFTAVSCDFADNTTGNGNGSGGAIDLSGGGVRSVRDCSFVSNGAKSGGAISFFGALSVTRCVFTANSAVFDGGAIFGGNGANTTRITNCRFQGNITSANVNSFGGGGIFGPNHNYDLTNCEFSGNVASGTNARGGGCWFTGGSLTNCTFRANSAGLSGGALFVGAIPLKNCIVFGNTAPVGPQVDGAPSVSYSCIQGEFAGTGNISSDPQFIDPDGADNTIGTGDDDLRLLPASPCIDAADNAAVPADAADLDGDSNTAETTPLDLDRGRRLADRPATTDTGIGLPPIADMGAFEFSDCNSNGVDDGEDIVQGTSLDANNDGEPDECSLWASQAGLWSNAANWQPPVVPNNDPMSGLVFVPTIEGAAANAQLDINAVVDTLNLNAQASLTLTGGDLTIASPNTIVNNGVLTVGDNNAIIARVSFNLTGTTPVTLAGPNASLRSEDGTATITSTVPVQGQGRIEAPFHNESQVIANVPGATLSITGQGTIVNNGELTAMLGGTLLISADLIETQVCTSSLSAMGGYVIIGQQTNPVSITGCGPVIVRPGSPASILVDNGVLLNSSEWDIGDNQTGLDATALMSLVNGSTGVVQGPVLVHPNGTLNISNSSLSANSLTIESGGTLTVASQMVLSGSLSNLGLDEARWSWDASSTLTLAGGTLACTATPWTRLEAAGTDLGPATGYSNNFDLSILNVAHDAAVLLVDSVDNGNRNGPAGEAEAVYADALVVGAGATLNLNSLRLYVAGAQIPAGAYGDGEILNIPLPVPFTAGDVNHDGAIDGRDVSTFVSVVLSTQPSLHDLCAADMNGSGTVGDSDIAAFVQSLLAGA